MGPCVICGQKAIEIESLFVRNGKAFTVKLGKNYCINCGGKRIREIEKIVITAKNPLSLLGSLKFFEELEILE